MITRLKSTIFAAVALTLLASPVAALAKDKRHQERPFQNGNQFRNLQRERAEQWQGVRDYNPNQLYPNHLYPNPNLFRRGDADDYRWRNQSQPPFGWGRPSFRHGDADDEDDADDYRYRSQFQPNFRRGDVDDYRLLCDGDRDDCRPNPAFNPFEGQYGAAPYYGGQGSYYGQAPSYAVQQWKALYDAAVARGDRLGAKHYLNALRAAQRQQAASGNLFSPTGLYAPYYGSVAPSYYAPSAYQYGAANPNLAAVLSTLPLLQQMVPGVQQMVPGTTH